MDSPRISAVEGAKLATTVMPGYKIMVSLHLPSYAHIMRIMEVCP